MDLKLMVKKRYEYSTLFNAPECSLEPGLEHKLLGGISKFLRDTHDFFSLNNYAYSLLQGKHFHIDIESHYLWFSKSLWNNERKENIYEPIPYWKKKKNSKTCFLRSKIFRVNFILKKKRIFGWKLIRFWSIHW